MIIRLTRKSTGSDGTFGHLVGFDFDFHCGELPWKENEASLSCIPAGSYECHWQNSPRFGWCYEVTGVPNRSRILIHSGNYCGDVEKGKRSDVEGCILLGTGFGVLNGQKAILHSRLAIKEFHAKTKEQPFALEIVWAQ